MERRKQPRIAHETNLQVRTLGDDPAILDGRMVDVSPDGMRFIGQRAVAPGTAICIDRPDGMILGEVCHCSPDVQEGFQLGIIFHQVLANLRDLEPLLSSLQSYEQRATEKSRR